MLSSLKRFSSDEVALERLRIINFYFKHGELATYEAFKVNRKLVYVWKKRLKANQGKLSSLIPFSTAPKRVRKMETHPLVVEHISYLREQHFRLGRKRLNHY